MGGREPLLLRCPLILPCSGCEVVRDVVVYVEDGVIEYVGSELKDGYRRGVVIECPRRSIAIPCLYNAHTHTGMLLFRGSYDDEDLESWSRKISVLEKRLQPWMVYHASRLAALEALSSSTCGLVDTYLYPRESMKALRDVGVRALVGRLITGIDDLQEARRAFDDAKAIRGEGGGLIGAVIDVREAALLPPETLKVIAEQALELGVPLQIHVSQTRREVYVAKKRHGRFPIELLESIGALTPLTILVNTGWVASWELNLVSRKGARLAFCPTTTMKLATGGHFPLKEVLEAGINVGLGTGSPAASNSLNMLREMRVMILLQRFSYWDTRIGARDALKIATEGSARLMGVRAGAIEEGRAADIAVVSLKNPWFTPLTANNIISHIVYNATPGDVEYTIVNGRPVYAKNSEHIQRLLEESREKLEEAIEALGGAVS